MYIKEVFVLATIKRNIVLSNKSNHKGSMALITLERKGSHINGNIKTYNIAHKQVVLGISCNNKEVFKNSIDLDKTHSFVISPSFNLESKISSVLVSQDNNVVTPLVWGSEDNNNYKQQFVDALSNSYINNTSSSATHTVTSNKKDTSKDLDKLFDIEPESELEAIIEQEMSKDNKPLEMSEETIKLKASLKEGQIFYDLVSEQIQDLFSKYPSVQELEELIPNSKWVKVDYENNGDDYVLGLIYEDAAIKYICYGVPGEYSQEPPKNIESYSQWLPLNPKEPQLGGYWVMYQDALNGDNIEIETI